MVKQQFGPGKLFAKTFLLIGLPLISLMLCSCDGSAYGGAQPVKSTEELLVQRTLELAVLERELPDVELLLEQDVIIISDDNINPEWVPRFESMNFRVAD